MSGIGPRQLHRVADSLSTRDWEILRFLSTQTFASTIQLRRVHFWAHTNEPAATRACLRVLHRLLEHRLVGRLERRIGGVRHGSAGFIWHLDVAGERLTRPADTPRRYIREVSTTFLDHTLAITETVATLHELTRTDALRLNRLEVEAAAWRSFLSPHDTTTILKPDLYVTLSSPEYDDHWYIEVDRGTESVAPVLLYKCRTYAVYKATGRAQAEHGVFPRVLWVVPTQRRVDRLTATIHGDGTLPDRLFTVITPERFVETLRDPDTSAAPNPRKEEP